MIEIGGVIGWDTTANEFKNELSLLSGDIIISINSGGGSIFEGIEIHNAIKAHEGKVHLIVGALCASMGTYIAMAADTVEVKDNSTFMIHNGWTYAMGDHNVLRKEADNVESLSKILAKAYIKKTSKSEDEIKKLMDAETYYYGKEIVDNGFAETVLDDEENEVDKDTGFALVKESLKNCHAIYAEKLYKKDQQNMAKILASMPSENEKIEILDGGFTAQQIREASETIANLQSKIG